MQNVPVAEVVRKVGRLVRCPRCEGRAREGRGLMSRPCGCCGGRGKVVQVEQIDRYQATQGADVLDEGGPLEDILGNVLPTLQFIDGDVILWRIHEERGPQAVAVLSLTKDGPAARWL